MSHFANFFGQLIKYLTGVVSEGFCLLGCVLVDLLLDRKVFRVHYDNLNFIKNYRIQGLIEGPQRGNVWRERQILLTVSVLLYVIIWHHDFLILIYYKGY